MNNTTKFNWPLKLDIKEWFYFGQVGFIFWNTYSMPSQKSSDLWHFQPIKLFNPIPCRFFSFSFQNFFPFSYFKNTWNCFQSENLWNKTEKGRAKLSKGEKKTVQSKKQAERSVRKNVPYYCWDLFNQLDFLLLLTTFSYPERKPFPQITNLFLHNSEYIQINSLFPNSILILLLINIITNFLCF